MQISSQRTPNQSAGDILAAAADRAFNPAKYRKSQKPKWARFKLKFSYRDGNESCHFSYDWQPDYSTGKKKYNDDEVEGFTKLLSLIDKNRIKDTFNSATIYMTVSVKKDTSVQDYDNIAAYIIRGKEISISPKLKFTTENKVNLQVFTDQSERPF